MITFMIQILLIEDEAFISDLYKRQLDLAGFSTDVAPTGKEGLEMLSKKEYDLLLLDIMLPDINGLEILKKVKSEDKKNMAVIILSNLGQESVVQQGFKLGADGYLIKVSFTPDQVVEEVKNSLRARGKYTAS